MNFLPKSHPNYAVQREFILARLDGVRCKVMYTRSDEVASNRAEVELSEDDASVSDLWSDEALRFRVVCLLSPLGADECQTLMGETVYVAGSSGESTAWPAAGIRLEQIEERRVFATKLEADARALQILHFMQTGPLPGDGVSPEVAAPVEEATSYIVVMRSETHHHEHVSSVPVAVIPVRDCGFEQASAASIKFAFREKKRVANKSTRDTTIKYRRVSVPLIGLTSGGKAK